METSYPARDRIEYIIAFINEFGKGFFKNRSIDLDLEKALDVVYSSEIFRKLSDPATALFKEGPAYIYSYLKDELSKGKI